MSKTNESPVSNISIKDNSIGGISFPSGSTLEVKFVDGKKEGEGIGFNNNSYGGILRNGEGSLLEKEKIVYTGDWKKGKREGKEV